MSAGSVQDAASTGTSSCRGPAGLLMPHAQERFDGAGRGTMAKTGCRRNLRSARERLGGPLIRYALKVRRANRLSYTDPALREPKTVWFTIGAVQFGCRCSSNRSAPLAIVSFPP